MFSEIFPLPISAISGNRVATTGMASSDDEFRSRAAVGWKKRIIIPTLLAGAVGGAFGLISNKGRNLGIANVPVVYSANLAIVAACYCGAREVARDARESDPDDLINSAIGGFASGALLGRLQGGQLGAIRYSIIFAVAGTTLDFAVLHLRPILHRVTDSVSEGIYPKNGSIPSWWKIPEWSPIQVLDEEALAKKQAGERMLGRQNEE